MNYEEMKWLAIGVAVGFGFGVLLTRWLFGYTLKKLDEAHTELDRLLDRLLERKK